MDQFTNRGEGIRALHEASEALARASAALHEREGGRENLIGATSEIVGGLRQAVQALADQIMDGVPAAEGDGTTFLPTEVTVDGVRLYVEAANDGPPIDLVNTLMGVPEVGVGQVWLGISGNRLVVREVKNGRARLSYEDDPGDERWEDVADIRTAFTLASR